MSKRADPPAADSPRAGGRRAEYAELTRQGIVSAASELFLQRGFTKTTVEAIAQRARVAVATVHAVGGGKHGLLQTVIEAATTDTDVQTTYDWISGATDGVFLLDHLCIETRARFERWNGLMRVVAAASSDVPAAAEAQQLAHHSLRGGLVRAGARLEELDALREGLDAPAATDQLWFFLSNNAYNTLVDDNGWSLDRAQTWLSKSLRALLLR